MTSMLTTTHLWTTICHSKTHYLANNFGSAHPLQNHVRLCTLGFVSDVRFLVLHLFGTTYSRIDSLILSAPQFYNSRTHLYVRVAKSWRFRIMHLFGATYSRVKIYLLTECAYSELEAQGADRTECQACVTHKAFSYNCHLCQLLAFCLGAPFFLHTKDCAFILYIALSFACLLCVEALWV